MKRKPLSIKNKALLETIKEILNNNVCNVQSLDNAADRTRVAHEIFNMLITKYELKKIK